jgi:arylsulfatase A-like enzyme
VSLVDLAPTILEAVGAEPLAPANNLPGGSLLPMSPSGVRLTDGIVHAAKRPMEIHLLRRLSAGYYVGYPPEPFDSTNDLFEERDIEVDPVSWTPEDLCGRSPRCQASRGSEEHTRLSFGGRWLS